MGERMPKSYMALERALIAERAKRVPPVLSWEEFRELAKRCGVDDDLGTLHHHHLIFMIITISVMCGGGYCSLIINWCEQGIRSCRRRRSPTRRRN
jgi:hypothetical protein